MKTIKVSDLSGVELDYWVAKCKGLQGVAIENGQAVYTDSVEGVLWSNIYSPSTNWNDCGPLLEDGGIAVADSVGEFYDPEGMIAAYKHGSAATFYGFRSEMKTLICRAFIASKKGEEFNAED